MWVHRRRLARARRRLPKARRKAIELLGPMAVARIEDAHAMGDLERCWQIAEEAIAMPEANERCAYTL